MACVSEAVVLETGEGEDALQFLGPRRAMPSSEMQMQMQME